MFFVCVYLYVYFIPVLHVHSLELNMRNIRYKELCDQVQFVSLSKSLMCSTQGLILLI